MKVVVISPGKALAAVAASCLLVAGSLLGGLALWGALRGDAAEASGTSGVGAKRWYFAEGYTGPGFEEWILIYNPPDAFGGSGEALTPNLQLYSNNGYIGPIYGPRLEPGQRASININEMAKSLYNYSGDVSIVVYGGYPFLCERALYFNYKGQISGGSQSWGYPEVSAE